MKYKKNHGFTILESIIYIFLSTIILAEGISLFVSEYDTYLKIKNDSIRANEYDNFYINLNNIISEGTLEDVIVGNDYIELNKGKIEDNLKKTIRVYEGKLVVVYSKDGNILTYNNMLYNVEKIEVVKKENLIYMNIYDENGEEFICCV
ncbi:MAG: hypothetical protein ACI398_03010 [Clostridium sp.]